MKYLETMQMEHFEKFLKFVKLEITTELTPIWSIAKSETVIGQVYF